MYIKRISKCIWYVNGERFDTRTVLKDKWCRMGENKRGSDIINILWQYYEPREKDLTYLQLDKMICRVYNENLDKMKALQFQTIYI